MRWNLVPGLLAACCAISASAQPEPFTPAISGQDSIARFTVAPGAFDAWRDARHAHWDRVPVGRGEQVALDLERFEVFAPDATIVVGSATGEIPAERPNVALFRGSVVGEPDAWAFIALSPRGVNGVVWRGGATHILSSGPGGGESAAFDLADLPPDRLDDPFVCRVEELTHGPREAIRAEMPVGSTPRAEPCRVIMLAIETDWEWMGAFGNDPAAAAAYAATLVGGVSEIYRREFNANFVINYMRTWADDSDPYPPGDIGQRLGQFRDHWAANMRPISRNLAHIFSGAGGGGVAWVGVICNKDWGFAASNVGNWFPYPLADHHWGNWDLMVVAHETGHNLNAPHTHDTTPVIDGCGLGDCSQAWGGTIMSYCHTCSGGMNNIVLQLHPRIMGEYILPYLTGWAPCDPIAAELTITQQPESATTCPGVPVTLSVEASGTGPLSYQWERYGIKINGATNATYTIQSPKQSDAGSYTVVVTSPCGQLESDSASIGVSGPLCEADANGDCRLNIFDFLAFQTLFGYGDPTADLSGNGVLDIWDFLAFQAYYGLCE